MSTAPEQAPIYEFKVWVRHEDGQLVCHYFFDTSTQSAVNSLREAQPGDHLCFSHRPEDALNLYTMAGNISGYA